VIQQIIDAGTKECLEISSALVKKIGPLFSICMEWSNDECPSQEYRTWYRTIAMPCYRKSIPSTPGSLKLQKLVVTIMNHFKDLRNKSFSNLANIL
jgi:hypothetical protein